MRDPEALPLLGLRTPGAVRACLDHLGWSSLDQGDWAYVYRSPTGRLVARLAPFEPVYGHFVDLCRRCAGIRYLPHVELAVELDGGGHLTVLEHLKPAPVKVIKELLRTWEHPEDADAELRRLRDEVDRIDAWGRRGVRWWSGVDLGARHILQSAGGQPKVIDVFCVVLPDLLGDLNATLVALAQGHEVM
ncbi:hypothetical protein, partial [Mangrovactinospora gilvigrisea]|uniref:hypothetical protein n=1 Tax=Mangrovactinospora gilvigrisea TaxID=1428644 RepID=UPI000A4073EC